MGTPNDGKGGAPPAENDDAMTLRWTPGPEPIRGFRPERQPRRARRRQKPPPSP